MKLLPKKSLLLTLELPKEKEEKPPKKTKKGAEKLPPDTYKDEIPAKEMYLDENRKFIISVKRNGDEGLPHVDIRQFQTTEMYTGFTKKGINFPLELLPELIEMLQGVDDECEKKGI